MIVRNQTRAAAYALLAALGFLAGVTVFLTRPAAESPARGGAELLAAYDARTEASPEVGVSACIATLQELALASDSNSLARIMAELASPHPGVRKAALEATVQFGSREAIPKLEEAALRAKNRQEKKEISEAIEFLKLPSLTEVLQKERDEAAFSQIAAPPRVVKSKPLPPASRP